MMEKDMAAPRRRIEAEENAAIDFQFTLIDLLRETGCTKRELAERLEISKSRVSQLFAAGSNPTIKQIARIFDALGYNLELRAGQRASVEMRDTLLRTMLEDIRVPKETKTEAVDPAAYQWRSVVPPANENGYWDVQKRKAA